MLIDLTFLTITVIIISASAFALGCLFMFRRMRNCVAGKVTSSEEEDSNVLKHNVKMWSAFSDAMPIHFFVKNADDDFRYVYSNKNRNDFFGLSYDEMIGKNDMVLLPAESAKAQLASDLEIMNKPLGVYRGLCEGVGSDGKKRVFMVLQRKFTDGAGKHLLWGAALDVTEQEEGREHLANTTRLLEERELWLSRTLQSIGDAVIVTDKHGDTVLLNPVAERLLGVKAKDAVGKPHDEVFHIVGSTDHEPRLSPVGRALRTGAIVELANNTDLVSSDGGHYHISDSAAPIMDEQKNIQGAVLVFRDVTEAYLRRAELNTAVNNWEVASIVSGIVSFRMDYRTRKITGSRRLAEFWPIVDGKAVPSADWILPEFASDGDKLFADVAEGRAKTAHFEYCAMKNGKVCRYRIFCAPDSGYPGEIAGIIQDITEAYESEFQLQNTRMMWNSLIDILPLNFFAKKVDDHFRYTHCNKRFADFVGKPVDEIIGKTDFELFQHQDESERILAQDTAIAKSQKPENFMESILGAHKERITYQTIKMPCVGPNGERLLLGVSIDITELAMLNKSQEILRQGLEMLVAETDVNEGVSKAMKLVCEYMGVARSYILHFNTEKKTVSCIREYCRQGEERLLDGLEDKPYSTDLDWQKHFEKECFLNIPDLQNSKTLAGLGTFYAKLIKTGDFRSLYCHRLMIDGKFWGYVGLTYTKNVRILDRRELDFVQSAARFIELMIRHKRVQTELHDAVIQARTAEKAKSRFLATMSHEIRTPLNAVIGFSELLKDDTLPDGEKKDYLNDISIAGNALLSLINDILDISKLEAGKMQFSRKATNLSEVVHEIMVVFQQKFKDKHLKEIVNVTDLPRVEIDPLRMRQILFNLVGNAVKFTDVGSIAVSAKFLPDGGGTTGTLRIYVKDTGCGISPEDKERLFQPFVQSASIAGTQKAGCGSGLGLLLVRRMLEYMNGEITLNSILGRGSEFIVTLHDVKYLTPSAFLPENVALQRAEKISITDRILLVDDVPMNLKVMQAMLQKNGLKSVAVGSGAEVLAVLEKEPFDILLTDMWMPGMNGMELAETIRHSGKHRDLHIVVVTADTNAVNIFDPRLFDDVLVKPVTFEKIRCCLGKLKEKK